MEKFTFTIEEHVKVWQTGTVTVEAKTLEEAKEKALRGEYEHHGDNKVLFDAGEEVIEREINTWVT